MKKTPTIQVTGLTKSFDDKLAVKGLDLEVYKGEIFGFLGPNGSGKTTTIRMLCGLLTPDSGQGQCLGYDLLKEQEAIRSSVGYMTQRFSLYEDLSVEENIVFFSRIYTDSVSVQPIEGVLDDFKLTPVRKKLAGALSGGWKQRLALACSMLHKPSLLLLDEPTAGVDPQARRDFWEKVNQLSASGMTVLLSTHYMDEAVRCHRLAYLISGELKVCGTASEIIKASDLKTWSITGSDLTHLYESLVNEVAITQRVFFGNELHVSGLDSSLISSSIEKYLSSNQTATPIDTGLEDVFIQLTQTHKESTA